MKNEAIPFEKTKLKSSWAQLILATFYKKFDYEIM